MDIKVILYALIATLIFAIINETIKYFKDKRQALTPTKNLKKANRQDIAILLDATKHALIKAGLQPEQIANDPIHLAALISDKLVVEITIKPNGTGSNISLACYGVDKEKQMDPNREDAKEISEALKQLGDAVNFNLEITIILAAFASMIVKFNKKYTKTTGQIKDYML